MIDLHDGPARLVLASDARCFDCDAGIQLWKYVAGHRPGAVLSATGDAIAILAWE
jgi:hypothetical protein